MSKRLPPLNALRVFDAAARHLSFTKAAEELFVTQAAVSHQIKSLEDFLGLKLFRRRNRSLLLTEEGQSYYLDIKEIFSALNEATRKLQARSAKGALTVSYCRVLLFNGSCHASPALIWLIRESMSVSRPLTAMRRNWPTMWTWRFSMVGVTGLDYGWKNSTQNTCYRSVLRR